MKVQSLRTFIMNSFCCWLQVGLATTAGAQALLDNFPAQDATIVAKAKRAGAVILAKVNLSEWAFSATTSVSLVHKASLIISKAHRPLGMFSCGMEPEQAQVLHHSALLGFSSPAVQRWYCQQDAASLHTRTGGACTRLQKSKHWWKVLLRTLRCSRPIVIINTEEAQNFSCHMGSVVPKQLFVPPGHEEAPPKQAAG